MWERAFVLVPLADVAPDLVAERLDAVDADGIAPTALVLR
jgi:7,8-dihydro-6-hydroxymethylpterin-pyrophosphokinase